MSIQKHRKIYTEADWHAADPIDRIYMHLMEPERWELTQAEDEKLEALRMVWSIICKQSTPRARIRMISQQIDVTERTVQRYINDAQTLFGDILTVDMDLELNLAYSRLMKLHDKATKSGDYETARRCQDNALLVLARIEARGPKEKKIYSSITFTSNPIALKARNDGEYTEFELDEPTSLLEPQAIGVPASD